MARRQSNLVMRRALFLSFSLWTSFWAHPLPARGEEAAKKKATTKEEKKDAGKEKPKAGTLEVPPEYKGAALPLQASETSLAIRKAEEHFSSQDWGRGFAALDEVLERVTSPPGKKKRASEAEEKKEKSAEKGAEDETGVALPVFRGPMGGPMPSPEVQEEPEIGPGEEVWSANGVAFLPVAAALRKRLLELPKEAREVYQRTYEAPARAALEKAKVLLVAKALHELQRVGERYPLTASGSEAWGLLGDLLLNLGRHGEAARAMEARLELPLEGDQARATALAQAATAHLLAGGLRSAASLIDALEKNHSETTVLVRGEAVLGRSLRGHPFFRDLLRRASEPGDTQFLWPTARGTFDHAAINVDGSALPALGSQARWIYALAPGESAGDEGARPAGASPLRGVSRGDRVYLWRSNDIVGLDARSGKARWAASPGELGESARALGFAPAEHGYGGDPGESTLTLSLYDPQALSPRRPGRALVLGVNRRLRMAQSRSGRMTFEPNLLVAYDAENGKLAWTVGQVKEEKDPIYQLAFTGPPAVAGSLLISPAVRGESFYAVAVTPRGRVAWVRRLYSYSLSYFARYGRSPSQGTPFAAHEGLVAAASGHGLVTVMQAASGEVRWVSRYRSQIRQRFSGSRPWRSAPMILGEALIVLPEDSDFITAFALRTGVVLWERQISSSSTRVLLGGDMERIYLGGEKVRAILVVDGTDAWESDLKGVSVTSGFVAGSPGAGGRILLAGVERGPFGSLEAPGFALDDSLAFARPMPAAVMQGAFLVLDSRDGSVLSRLRLLDPRLKKVEAMSIFLSSSQILAGTSSKLFALEPEAASWKGLGGGGSAEKPAAHETKLFQRARLLRAEGRYAEALLALDQLRKELPSRERRDEVDKDILATARSAAEATKKASFITELLHRPDPILKGRRETVAFRLLEAKLLLEEGSGGEKSPSAEDAIRTYTEISKLDGLIVLSPEGLQVDAGAYAADVLRDLSVNGRPIADPKGEEWALHLLERAAPSPETGPTGFGGRDEACVALRRSHLGAAREALRRLAKKAEEAGETWRAADLLSLLAEYDPAFSSRARELAGKSAPSEPICVGLENILSKAAGKPLAQQFWAASEEGFLAATAPGSAPLPALLAISKSSLRAYNKEMKIIFERELPDYPDVSWIKVSLQSHIEEPAVVDARDGRLILFTAAGLYGFSGASSAGPGKPLELRPREFKLRWTRSSPHPFTDLERNRGGWWWGSLALPGGKNFFPELVFAQNGDPVVLLPDGALFSVDSRTGKYRWRFGGEASLPSSPPSLKEPWVIVRSSSPDGLALYRTPQPVAGEGRKEAASAFRFLPCPSKGVAQASLLAAGLATCFAGTAVEVADAGSGRLLWRSASSSARLAFQTPSELWFSELDGKLVSRSLRSGRVRRTVALPEDSAVIEVFEDGAPPSPGPPGDPPQLPSPERTLVLTRHPRLGPMSPWAYSSQTETGTDLFLLKLNGRGEKVWESRLHKGSITYKGGRFLAAGGKYVLLFNAEVEPEKWYTRAVLVDPALGSDGGGSPDGRVRDLLSVEIHSKGTGQIPRLAILEDGLAVGNADGFGYYVPKD